MSAQDVAFLVLLAVGHDIIGTQWRRWIFLAHPDTADEAEVCFCTLVRDKTFIRRKIVRDKASGCITVRFHLTENGRHYLNWIGNGSLQ